LVASIVLAAVGAAAAAAATASHGNATDAIQAIPPGLKIALAHVPSWTHAYHVLMQHLAALAQGVSSGHGTANASDAAKKAIAHAFGHAK